MPDSFEDKIRDVLTQGGDALNAGLSRVNAGLNTRMEIVKAQTRIGTLSSQIEEHMDRLGRIVYEGWKESRLDDMAARTCCQAAAALEEEKKALEEKIVRLKEALKAGPSVCAYCGVGLHEGAVFCHICGRPVGKFEEEQKAPLKEEAGLCPACGNPLEKGSRYCFACGAPVPGSEKEEG